MTDMQKYEYELTVVIETGLEYEYKHNFLDSISSLVRGLGGAVVDYSYEYKENYTLAYPVTSKKGKTMEVADYAFYKILLPEEKVSLFSKILEKSTMILRFLLVKDK